MNVGDKVKFTKPTLKKDPWLRKNYTDKWGKVIKDYGDGDVKVVFDTGSNFGYPKECFKKEGTI